MGIFDTLTSDTVSARERDVRLRQRAGELREQIEALEDELEELQERSVAATATGDAEAADEGREERMARRLELDDAQAALERIREEREALRPAVLREEAEEQAAASREAMEEAADELEELGREVDRLARGPFQSARQAYSEAVAAARRVHELRRKLAERGETLGVRAPDSIDHKLREEQPKGWRVFEALSPFLDRS